MKEFVAKVGGRYTYKEDWFNMQNLSLSVAEIFYGCNPFIISGCAISGATGNKTIDPGYIWMNGKIRYFDGKTGVDLATPNYLIESVEIESVKYTGGGTKEGINDYKVIWGDTTPAAGTAYIVIPADGTLPDINDEFFGKYAILSNTSFTKQTINKLLQLNDALDVYGTVNIGNSTNQSDLRVNRVNTLSKQSQIRLSIDSTGTGALQQYYDGYKAGEMTFDPINKVMTLKINGNDQFIVTDGGIQLKSTTIDGSLTNGALLITSNSINRYSGDADDAGINLNYSGYNGGNTRFRDVVIYDGKGSQIVKFEGQTRTLAHYGVILQNNDQTIGMKFKDTLKTYSDNAFQKYMTWNDKNDFVMFKFGYTKSSDNNIVLDNSVIGDIEITPKQYLKVTKPIFEEGVLLSNKYADKSATSTALGTKVDKVSGKALSTNDFTTTLKTKLENITTAVIEEGNTDFATGDQVWQNTKDKLNKDNNLSEVDPALARENLVVYSKGVSDGKYLIKANNLSDVDAPTARTNLDVPKVGDSYLKSQVYTKTEVFSKNEITSTYQPLIGDTGWLDANNPDSTSQFNIKVRRYGNVVNIIGTAQKAGDNKIWFAVPASIPAPPYGTGQVLDVQADDDAKYNRGMIIKCEGGSKNFYVRQESGAKTVLYVNITYLV